MTKILPALFLSISLLYSCAGNEQNKEKSPETDSTGQGKTDTPADSSAKTDYYTIQGDSLLIAPFEVGVILSTRAKDRIVNDKETIIVSVFFDGTPKKSADVKLEEDGSFFVGTASKEIVYGQVARFDSIKVAKAIYDQLAEKDFDVSVNVCSGRKSSENNLLNCEPVFDKISNVVYKKFILKGKLIYGDE